MAYHISSGQTSSGIILTGESMYVYDGGLAVGTKVNSSGTAEVSSGGVMENTTVNSRGVMRISSGGTGSETTVNSRGGLHVSEGGSALAARITSGGSLNVSSGGLAASARVASGGRFTVMTGGRVTESVVSSGGRFTVSAGGSATGLTAKAGAYLDFTVDPDTLINGSYAGSALDISGGHVSGITFHSGWMLTLTGGGNAAGVTFDGGTLYVENGGDVDGLTLKRGTAYIFDEATAANITVYSGSFTVSDQGAGENFAVSAGGDLNVYRQGTVTHVSAFADGRMAVYSGGELNSASVYSGGQLNVSNGGLAFLAQVFSGGRLNVSSGGTAAETAVSSGGILQVSEGGIADSAGIGAGARMILETGGSATCAEVCSGGTLKIGSGGTVTLAEVRSGGRLLGYYDCGDVSFDPGGDLYFDVSGIAAGNPDALVNLAGLSGGNSLSYKLLISDSQEKGIYKLADGAGGFDRTISVCNEVMELGTIAPDQTVRINGKEFTLDLNESELVLSVSAPPVQLVYLDLDGEAAVRYNNPDLGIELDVAVTAPGFTAEQRESIVSELTRKYNKNNISFTLERPESGDYSTLYFGKSTAFEPYGEFYGVAETHDGNNLNSNDNAFVLVDGSFSTGQAVSTAAHMLDHLLGFSYSAGDGTMRDYAENTTLLQYSADWVQSDPYNKFCPIDPATEDRCITGCTNNAASQIIYYWLEKGLLDLKLQLDRSDAYVCTTNVTIDSSDHPASGHLSFAETNRLLGDFQLKDMDSIAALCFAAGVLQKAQYSSVSTGAFWNKNLFVRAGFDPGVTDRYMTVINWPEESASYVDPETRLDDDDFMVNELLNSRPVGIVLKSLGHAVVVDGYDSSRNMFHLNYGWGEEHNQWSTLAELADLQINEAVCGIAPVTAPGLTVENLTAASGPAGNAALSFTVSNQGKDVSEETFAYIYCGDELLGNCGMNYISPGYSREFSCTVDTSSLPVGENTLTVKVGTQKGDGSVSEQSVVYDNPERAKWTYLMYFATDNDQDGSALYDLISIQQTTIESGIDVYVLVDSPEYPYDMEEGDVPQLNGTLKWDSFRTDTRVGKIKYDPSLTVSVDWESWDELDTGSISTLERFVDWAQTESPAENYALVLWDHGVEDGTFCYDFTTDPNQGAYLSAAEVSGLLKEKGNIPLVIYNSCLTASEIVSTQMAGSTEVIAAPEAPSISTGATYVYRDFFGTITADMTAREMASVLVRSVRETDELPYPSMLAAIDVTDTRLGDSLEALAQAVAAAGNINDLNVLVNAQLNAPHDRCIYEGSRVKQSDLYDLILQARADSGYADTSDGFRTALANVEAALNAVVLDCRTAPGGSGYGVAVFNPVCVSESYLASGYTPARINEFVSKYLARNYGSNPQWGNLLYEVTQTYLKQHAVPRPAVFEVAENSELVDGKVVPVDLLGCFSGRGETVDGVTLNGEDVCFGFTVTAADLSTGGFRAANDAGTTVHIALLAGDGTVLASGDDSVAFGGLAAGDYFIRLGSETECGIRLSCEGEWLTGVDRFDYAGSGRNEKHVNGNGTPAEASVLGAGYYSGMLTSMGDSDFYQFTDTGTDLVRIAVESPDGKCLHVRAFDLKGIPGEGAVYKNGVYTLTMSVADRLFVEGDADLDQDQVNAYSITVIPYEPAPVVLSGLSGTEDGVSWRSSEVDRFYCVEYSMDNFEHVLSKQTSGWAVDTPELPEGTYQWRVKVLSEEEGGVEEWFVGDEIVSDSTPETPKAVQSDADGDRDVFFASPNGIWNKSCRAQHVGSVGGWTGTKERISPRGKGRIQDLFFGSADLNTLCLTDAENGDALFADDVYTDSPEKMAEETARLFRIGEIFAGAGDDIVDMTSQRFEYVGGGLTIKGGDGSDVLWANKGDNLLFGDAGNDRIVGADGNDVIVGGIGNDRMHGGGGDDIFTFCEEWGADTVEQLAGGSVMLWFVSGSEENWNAETLTYTDGGNSVKVSGIAADAVTLQFGDDYSDLFMELDDIGAFADFTSERIFEDKTGGKLAAL